MIISQRVLVRMPFLRFMLVAGMTLAVLLLVPQGVQAEESDVPNECRPLKTDKVDLQGTLNAFSGPESGWTADHLKHSACASQPDDDTMVITESGVYELQLDWYGSAGKMVLAMLRPRAHYLGTFHGQHGSQTINLGWLEKGDHLVLGNAAFWHRQVFGPFHSGDDTTYDITKLSSTKWEVNMDEGVHFDSGFNDAHYFIQRVADSACTEVSETGDCARLKNDGIDLQGSMNKFEGILETGTGKSVVFNECPSAVDNEALQISEAGVYHLELDWYDSAGRMVIATERPVRRYLDTYWGKASGKKYNLGWLGRNEHLVFSNIAIWHSQKFGPFFSGDTTTYKITRLDKTTWEIFMDEGVHLDGGHNDAHFYLRKASMSCSPSATPGDSFFSYDERLRGGYYASAGNVIGDAQEEIVVGTGPGFAPHVRVFTKGGDVLSQFYAYDKNLRNGVVVTACNVDGKGRDEIVTAQNKGGWPLVKIFDGHGNIINDGFFVLDGKYEGGVNLSCGDVNGDGISDIVVAAQHGGGPHVLVYDRSGTIIANWFAYDDQFHGGINVTTIDMDNDGKDEVVTSPQLGVSHVQIFQIKKNLIKRLSPGFVAFHQEFRGGANVGGADMDGDGKKELLVSPGTGEAPLVKVYDIREIAQQQFYAFDGGFTGGVRVNGGDVDNDGKDEVVVTPQDKGGAQVRILEASNF